MNAFLSPDPLLEDGEPVVVLTHWRIAVQWIVSHPDWDPGERERTFVADMRRFTKRNPPTPAQAKWLRGIVERLGGRTDLPDPPELFRTGGAA